jgi:hypothetical protein
MSGQELLTENHFFSARFDDQRGGFWRRVAMGRCVPGSSNLSPVTDANGLYANFTRGSMTEKSKAVGANIRGVQDNDISHELVEFLVDVGRYHSSIDQSVTNSSNNMGIHLANLYDGLDAQIDAGLEFRGDLLKGVKSDNVNFDLSVLQREDASDDDRLLAAIIMEVTPDVRYVRKMVATFAKYMFLRYREVTASDAFGQLMTKDGGGKLTHTPEFMTWIVNNTNLMQKGVYGGVPGGIQELVERVVKNDAKAESVVKGLALVANSTLAIEFDNIYQDSKMRYPKINTTFPATKGDLVDLHVAIFSGIDKLKAKLKSVLRAELNRVIGNKNHTSLAQSPVAQNLYLKLHAACSDKNAVRVEVTDFFEKYLSLRARDPATGVWKSESVPFTTKIDASQYPNYRLNFTTHLGRSLFSESFCDLPALDCDPTTQFTGIIYPITSVSGGYKRLELQIAPSNNVNGTKVFKMLDKDDIRESFSAKIIDVHDPFPGHKLILKYIYLAAYNAAPGDLETDVVDADGELLIRQLSLKGSALNVIRFDSDIKKVYPIQWDHQLAMEKKAMAAIDENYQISADVQVLDTQGVIYRDTDFKWKKQIDGGIPVVYDANAQIAETKSYCSVLGLDENDARACSDFIVDKLSRKGDVTAMATGLTSLLDNPLFKSARASVAKMHPEIAVVILENLGFSKVNGPIVANRQIAAYETVEDWLGRIKTENPALFVQVNRENIRTYLRDVNACTVRHPSSLTQNMGLENPLVGRETSEYLQQLGIPKYNGRNNPYRIQANALYGVANMVSMQGVSALPSAFTGTVISPHPPRLDIYNGFQMRGGRRGQTGGAPASSIPQALFTRESWNAILKSAPVNKKLGAETVAGIEKDLKTVEEIASRRVPQLSEYLFSKKLANEAGDHTPQAWTLLDVANKKKKYDELVADAQVANYDLFRKMAAVSQVIQVVGGPTAPAQTIRQKANLATAPFNFTR